jgi:hypothetical protein
MTNIRNLFSQAIQGIPFTGKTKKNSERIKALDEQTQRATVEHTANLKRFTLSKDSVVLHAEGFSMEIQIHDDRVNVVYNYLKIILEKILA